MIRWSRRLLAKEYMKFFSRNEEYSTHYDRSFKDSSDSSTIMDALKDWYSTMNKKDMTPKQKLRAASVFNVMKTNAETAEEQNALGCLSLSIKKLAEDPNTQWLPEMISNFCIFSSRNGDTYKSLFKSSELLESIIDKCFIDLDNFDIGKIAILVNTLSANKSKSYKTLYEYLFSVFNKTTDFTCYNEEALREVTLAIFLKQNQEYTIENIQENSFSAESMTAFKSRIYTIFSDLDNKEDMVITVCKAFRNLIGPSRNEMFDFMFTALTKQLNLYDDMISSGYRQSPINKILNIAEVFDREHPYAESLFKQVTSTIFYHTIIKNGPKYYKMQINAKAYFFAKYLALSVEYKTFQYAFLDHIVKFLSNDPVQNNLEFFDSVLTSLALLNYPKRFSDSTPFLPVLKENWEKFLHDSTENVESILESFAAESGKMQLEMKKKITFSVISILWSYCFFQKFSQNLFTLALSPDILLEKYIEEDDEKHLSMLLVIQKSIDKETDSNISLSPELVKKLNKFQKKQGKAVPKKTKKTKEEVKEDDTKAEEAADGEKEPDTKPKRKPRTPKTKKEAKIGEIVNPEPSKSEIYQA